MLSTEFQRILSLDGLPFIKALLEYEEKRFDESFLKGSVYEEINQEFGIFPAVKNYPLYFMGDARKPENKIIVIGINPAYREFSIKTEQDYLEKHGSFEGYCTHFLHRGLFQKHSQYFSNIGGFLKRLGLFDHEKMSWEWLQEHLINMDLIPYRSSDSAGLRINNLAHYKERYFIPIIKIIEYLDPKKPIFIHGFRTFEKYLSNPMFAGLIDFEERDGIWVGMIAKKYKFIGTPFLTRVAGGKDKLAEIVLRNL
jgi:hypothetical protein